MANIFQRVGSWMAQQIAAQVQALTVEKPTVKLATMLSGGSLESTSLTWFARTTNVQISPWIKSLSGLTVKVVGPPVNTAVWLPLNLQESVYHALVTLTGSVKVTLTFVSVGT